ncbi:MAG: phosphate ABC transporter permease subunit PstC [Planctomycetota bacterium]|nr:phosphate ABC transporter permease subunit PstC [Planctomycetota bacterium]
MTPRRLSVRLRLFKERLIEVIIFICGFLSIAIISLICLFLAKEAISLFATENLLEVITGTNWYPISEPPKFGLVPLLLGSLFVTVGAAIIVIPLGVGTAIFISEAAPNWLGEILKPVVEVLASVPSVVVGFVALLILGPTLKNIFDLPTGLTALTGSIALAFMAAPTVISISEDALHAVPKSYREASLALGATKWQTAYRVTVPAASSGILAAVMLGIGRVIGETMAVMMVTGNAALIPYSFLQPVRTMTATIAAEMGEVVRGTPHYYALFFIGFVLFVITFFINIIADIFLRKGRILK